MVVELTDTHFEWLVELTISCYFTCKICFLHARGLSHLCPLCALCAAYLMPLPLKCPAAQLQGWTKYFKGVFPCSKVPTKIIHKVKLKIVTHSHELLCLCPGVPGHTKLLQRSCHAFSSIKISIQCISETGMDECTACG